MKHIPALFLFLFFLAASALAEAPARIVSLAPNLTEILYDLGLAERIVAVTAFCDYPPPAKEKPKIGGMANPSLEAIVAMGPDLVVMTEDGNPAAVESRLRKLGIRTHIFRAKRLHELPAGIRELGTALGAEGVAFPRADEIEQCLYQIRRRSLARATVRSTPEVEKVLFVVQPNPLIVAGTGTAIDDSLTLLGLGNIAADTRAGYANYSLEEIIVQAPDMILLGGGPGMSHEYAMDLLKRLESLEAVKRGRVCFIKDPLFRLGPRIMEGIREVEQCTGGTRSISVD